MSFKMILFVIFFFFTNTCVTLKAYSILFVGTTMLCLTELSCSVFIAMLLCSSNLNRKQPKVILTVKLRELIDIFWTMNITSLADVIDFQRKTSVKFL
jgi:hypothetical protein